MVVQAPDEVALIEDDLQVEEEIEGDTGQATITDHDQQFQSLESAGKHVKSSKWRTVQIKDLQLQEDGQSFCSNRIRYGLTQAQSKLC